MTDMMKEQTQEEILEDFPIEGVLEVPNQRAHDFHTLAALTDFIHAFKIRNGQFGEMQNGKWRLIYHTENN